MYLKEDKLFALLKYATKILSEFDSETGEMIQKLYAARDEQVYTLLAIAWLLCTSYLYSVHKSLFIHL